MDGRTKGNPISPFRNKVANGGQKYRLQSILALFSCVIIQALTLSEACKINPKVLRDRITISQCFFNLNLLGWGGGGPAILR